MTTAIKDSDLSGQTVRYGDVQIGGTGGPVISGTTIKSVPPKWEFDILNRYDDADRTVIGHRVRLTLRGIFYSESASLSSAQMRLIRRKLLEPRQQMYLSGTGCGFDVSAPDIGWGPKPVSCSIVMHGKCTADVNWVVEFEIAPCDVSNGQFPSYFKSFNFSQSYAINDEGYIVRATEGYWEIAPQLPGGVTQIADQFRDRFAIQLPTGFRRVSQQYQESLDKARMDFVVVDAQLTGDALPQFISKGRGTWSISTEGVGLTKGIATLSASLSVPPGVPPYTAALQFFLR